MEILSGLLFVAFYWWFLRSLAVEKQRQLLEIAGPLLMVLPKRNARRSRIVLTGIEAVVITLWILVLLPNAAYIYGGPIDVPRTFAMMGHAVVFVHIARFLVAPHHLLGSLRLHKEGLIALMHPRNAFFPWGSIRVCKWVSPPGTLRVRGQAVWTVYRLVPSIVEDATAILARHLPLEFAADLALSDTLREDRDIVPTSTDAERDEDRKRPILASARPQFSLRSLLLLVLTISVALAWIGPQLGKERAESQFLAPLKHANPEVRWAGMVVVWLDLSKGNRNVSDDDLVHVTKLKHLRKLNLSHTAITDAGLEHLHCLKTLRVILLWNTQVTEKGVERLQRALPEAEIVWDP